jgi:hypothetical protein
MIVGHQDRDWLGGRHLAPGQLNFLRFVFLVDILAYLQSSGHAELVQYSPDLATIGARAATPWVASAITP